MQFETFAPLTQIEFITHAFSLRADNTDTKADKFQDQLLNSLGFKPRHQVSAEQTHGNAVAVVTKPTGNARVPAVDALVTLTPGLPLLVRCADCAAVFIVDRAKRAIGLVHSGKTGTLANVVGNTIATMHSAFGTASADCTVFISPSIGPCHYEMDIWSGIEQQLRAIGVADIHNPRVCTACNLDRYFSYRAERGNTGRMIAALAITPSR